MSREEDNKAIVGRWFIDFWGTNVKLAVIDEIAAPDMLPGVRPDDIIARGARDISSSLPADQA